MWSLAEVVRISLILIIWVGIGVKIEGSFLTRRFGDVGITLIMGGTMPINLRENLK